MIQSPFMFFQSHLYDGGLKVKEESPQLGLRFSFGPQKDNARLGVHAASLTAWDDNRHARLDLERLVANGH